MIVVFRSTIGEYTLELSVTGTKEEMVDAHAADLWRRIIEADWTPPAGAPTPDSSLAPTHGDA